MVVRFRDVFLATRARSAQGTRLVAPMSVEDARRLVLRLRTTELRRWLWRVRPGADLRRVDDHEVRALVVDALVQGRLVAHERTRTDRAFELPEEAPQPVAAAPEEPEEIAVLYSDAAVPRPPRIGTAADVSPARATMRSASTVSPARATARSSSNVALARPTLRSASAVKPVTAALRSSSEAHGGPQIASSSSIVG